MLNTVTLLGSSSGRNAGDAAILSSIMDAVDEACKTELCYEIPTINTRFVKSNYSKRVVPISAMPWDLSLKLFGLTTLRSVKRTDLSLVFDAVLFDRSLYNPMFNFLSSLYVMLHQAKKAGKKIGFYNVSAGPVNTKMGMKMLYEISELCDFITVRDDDSYNLLRDLGVRNPRMIITADAALNTMRADEQRINHIFNILGLDPNEETLAVNVNAYLDSWSGATKAPIGREAFLNAYAGALNRVIKEIKTPLLFVSTQHHDFTLTEDLIKLLYGPRRIAHLSNRYFDHHDICGVLSKTALLFAMRLHAMILCSSTCTPIIGLAYLPKCHYYFNTLGLPEFSLGFEKFSEEALFNHIMNGWTARHELRDRLNQRIPVLQKNAKKAAQIVGAINHGDDIDVMIKSL